MARQYGFKVTEVRHDINKPGYNALRNGWRVQRLLYKHISRMEREAGGRSAGYFADVQPGQRRAHAMLKTGSEEARQDNAENNTLLKVMRR